MKLGMILLGIALGNGPIVWAANAPKVLIVVAHPDDDYYFAASVYRAVKEKNAEVDELIVTSGEGGYRFSSLSESIYHLKLGDEANAKENLASIREHESEAGGKIMGISHHFYLRQKDFGFTRDPELTLKTWGHAQLLEKIKGRLQTGHYQFVWVIAPIPSTHGHHQAASLLALEAVNALPEKERPVVLAGITDRVSTFLDSDQETEAKEGRSFLGLAAFPLSQIQAESPSFVIDRNQKFGAQNKLSFQIIVNWMIAEHKSQGLFQTFMNRDDLERFRVFSLSGVGGVTKASEFFKGISKP